MFEVIQITDAAVKRVQEIMRNSGKNARGIRVGVKNGGCAGMEYVVDVVADENTKDDKIEKNGVSVFVDPAATLFLIGTTMDYKEDKLKAGFVFDNPNQTSACGCGESVMLTPADPKILNGGK